MLFKSYNTANPPARFPLNAQDSPPSIPDPIAVHPRFLRMIALPKTPRPAAAFTLIEVLIVIAILGILTSLVITVYRSVAQDSRDVVARQQQAALQNALNNWVTGTTRNGNVPLSAVRSTYNSAASSKDRLDLVQAYLDEGTYNHFVSFTSDNTKIESEALSKVNKYIQFADWAVGSFPQVKLLP